MSEQTPDNRAGRRIGLITYNANHLKTEQLAIGLSQAGYRNLAVFGLPFVPRPARQILFEHRPDMLRGAPTRAIAEALGAAFVPVANVDEIPPAGADLFLIAGAGILPQTFVRATRGRVLNCHPGIIPLVRGLDAFKWAVLDQMPIGNTLHVIDELADAGDLIATELTPLFRDDSLEDFARRHYESEILMMLAFDYHLAQTGKPVIDEAKVRPARMRMPVEKQHELRDAFEAYKDRFAR